MMENENQKLIEYLTKCIERADRYIADAKNRGDRDELNFYNGQRFQANKTIIMLGGKWID